MSSSASTHPSRRENTDLISAGYFAAFVALGFVSASLGPTLNGLAAQTGVAISQISLLLTARASGYFLGSLLGGRLYDRVLGHPLMAGMLLVMALAMAFVPAISFFWFLVALLLVIGIAEAIVDVGGNAMIVWVHGRRVGPYMNALHFFFGAGALISPLIVGLILRFTGGIDWSYRLLALLVALPALVIVRTASPMTNKTTPDSASGPMVVNTPLVALSVLFMMLYVGAEVSFGGWVSTYATTMQLATAETAAYLASVFWGALTAGRLVAIPLAARLRPRTILLLDVLGCIASVGLILLRPEMRAALWIGAAGLGFSMASIFPTVLSWAGRRMTMTGHVTSWFLVGASIGAVVMPWVIGQLFERIGPRVVMTIIFGDLIAVLVLYMLLMHRGGEPAIAE